jgi:hypothetical protein
LLAGDYQDGIRAPRRECVRQPTGNEWPIGIGDIEKAAEFLQHPAEIRTREF